MIDAVVGFLFSIGVDFRIFIVAVLVGFATREPVPIDVIKVVAVAILVDGVVGDFLSIGVGG